MVPDMPSVLSVFELQPATPSTSTSAVARIP